MELKDLIGKHMLTGVDMGSQVHHPYKDEEYTENCQTISFVLDGVTYTVIEDPEDGYRSSMREIIIDGIVVENTFAPVEVLGVMRQQDKYGYKNEILDLLDTITAKVVLSAGTENTDDYYPCFVAEYTPENMAVNKK